MNTFVRDSALTKIFYITGTKVSYMDMWNNTYSDEVFMITNADPIYEIKRSETDGLASCGDDNGGIYIYTRLIEESYIKNTGELKINDSFNIIDNSNKPIVDSLYLYKKDGDNQILVGTLSYDGTNNIWGPLTFYPDTNEEIKITFYLDN